MKVAVIPRRIPQVVLRTRRSSSMASISSGVPFCICAETPQWFSLTLRTLLGGSFPPTFNAWGPRFMPPLYLRSSMQRLVTRYRLLRAKLPLCSGLNGAAKICPRFCRMELTGLAPGYTLLLPARKRVASTMTSSRIR